MEANRNVDIQSEKNDNGYTYVFSVKEDMHPEATISHLRRKIWQVFPTVCASMMVIPFGIMLGWPSPTYPKLVNVEDSPVHIDYDQSAMVAGFLMLGNSFGTPFSSLKRFSPKYGIIFSVALMAVGWAMMWQAKDIYWLLASRFFVGTGHGFGIGQLKIYIGEICEADTAGFLIKQINLYTFFGVIVAFAIGPFLDFQKFGIICVIITMLILFLAIFLPSTPRELLKDGKVCDAKKLIVFLSPEAKVDEEIYRIRQQMAKQDDDLSFLEILKNRTLRKKFGLFSFLVFFQQFTGIISTIVYSQILFTLSIGTPYPEFCALLYSITYFLANVFGIFYSTRYNKKYVLLFSSISVTLILIVKILVLVLEANTYFWNFSSLIVMLIFVIVHTVGLGNIPFNLITDYFPKNGTKVIVQFFVIFHSLLGLLITKIFQVMFDKLSLYAPFCLFAGISLVATIFIIIFVPGSQEKINKDVNFNPELKNGKSKDNNYSIQH